MTVDRGLIGIVSGLGPLAGSDVLDKLYQHAARRYHAVEDVDYPDVLLCLGPRTPVIDSNRVLAQTLADHCYGRALPVAPRRRHAVAS